MRPLLVVPCLLAVGCARAAPPEDWMTRWEPYILRSAERRYCDTEVGEEIGWLMSPFLNGFCYGWLATGDEAWLDRLIDWADAWIARGVTEPDGFVGWPKENGASTGSVTVALTDNLLGEAMGSEPLVRAARVILADDALTAKYGAKAREWVETAERTHDKWTARGCWRDVGDGGVWVVPTFGLSADHTAWDGPYDRRGIDGFTLPANKQNHIARWLLELWDATGKPIYRERAARWFTTFRGRLRERGEGLVWNYWDPAGPWDTKPDGGLKHWVGVHPNGGYYGIDAAGFAAAFEHGLIDRALLDRLIVTNRDVMWNQQIGGARFARIDGGEPDERWANSPGVLWSALAPHDETLARILEANQNPESWGGLASTPWWVAHQLGRLPAARTE